MTSLIFYDFECFKRLWTVVFIDPMNKQERVIVNDKDELEQYYNEHKDDIFIGYNSRSYDQWIFKAILCGFNPKEMNDWIIIEQRKGWEFSDLLRKFPINNFDVFSGYNGLKTLEAFMGNDVQETSIPFDYEGDFSPEMIADIIKYNRHDVEQTIQVFLHRRAMFDSHVALLHTFNLPIKNISKTQAQLAAVILGARPITTNDEWDIRLPHTLKLGKYQHIADWFLSEESHDDKSYLEVDVAGVPHVFAWGGVHGAISQYIHTCSEDEVMMMVDVDQLYPSLMVYYNLLSRAVHEPERFKSILATSLKLKKEGKKKEREPYKLICNITYGTMGDKFNPMYDPRNRALVCVFGQILLLDLIEKIEPYCKLIQSNTDGILVLLKKRDVDTFKRIVRSWEERTMLHMSYDEFKTVYQGDVNNYLAIDTKGGIKSKGAYVKELSALDNDLPIVNRAITNYLVEGIHPVATVLDSDELIDFQKIVKVSSKYAYGTLNGNRLTDKTFRVFASTRPEDGIIGKVKPGSDTIEKFANTPERCFIHNGEINGMGIPDYLDRGYYVELAVTRLREKFGVIVP